MRKISFLFFVSVFLASICAGQVRRSDSLLMILKTERLDTSKLFHLNKISEIYNNNGKFDSALIYAQQCIQLSGEIRKKTADSNIVYVSQKRKADACNIVGNIYESQASYNEALKYHLEAFRIFKVIGDKKSVGRTYNYLGLIYFDQGNDAEALKNYFIALKIEEENGDKYAIAYSYNTIGNVYYAQENYDLALKNYFSALKIYEAIRSKQGIGAARSNIGCIYSDQGKYSEALKYHLICLKLMEEIGNKRGVAISVNNIGNVHQALGHFDEALVFFNSSLKIAREIGDKASEARAYNNLGYFYLVQMRYNEARSFFDESKKLSVEIGFKECLKNVHSNLSIVDSATGNYKGAFENHKFFILYRDSIDNEETRKKTIQSQMTYDFEKKEAVAQAEHKKELESQQVLADEKSIKQKIVLVLVSCFLILVLVFAGFIFRSLRITRKQKDIIEQQRDVVEIQKKEVEEQKLMVEEHQKSIIDSITYARRIQRSLLPTEVYIDKQLKRLNKK